MLMNNEDYFQVLTEIKERIRAAKYRAVLGANKELIVLYWHLGNTIIANTEYGAKFVESLARDIKVEFPDARGYSVRNLNYMRKFAELMPDEQKVQTLSALLSWSHNALLFDKTKSLDEYLWYVRQAIESGWTLSKMKYYLESDAFSRQVRSLPANNYDSCLLPPLDGIAKEMLKDPYVFDFVEQHEGIIEREIEEELVANQYSNLCLQSLDETGSPQKRILSPALKSSSQYLQQAPLQSHVQ
jgi:predicted nuclease of restriction endonuclease-like (RecB) superfamily